MMYEYYTIPYNVFVDCILDANFQKLVIAGKYTEEQVSNRWDMIYEDFNAHINNGNYTDIVKFMRKLHGVTVKYNILAEALLVIGGFYVIYENDIETIKKECSEQIENLNKIGIKYNFKDTPQGYEEEMKRLQLTLSNFSSAIKINTAALEKLYENRQDPPTRQDYINGLAAVSRYIGISLRQDTLLCEYVSHLNSMIAAARLQVSKEIVAK